MSEPIRCHHCGLSRSQIEPIIETGKEMRRWWAYVYTCCTGYDPRPLSEVYKEGCRLLREDAADEA